MWAAIFNIWADEPIYHEIVTFLPDRKTRCGRRIGPFKPLIPKKHAVKFARRCKSCAQEAS